MHLPTILRSSVFRLTLQSAIVFLLSAITVLAVIGGLYLTSAAREVEMDLNETFDALYEIYQEHGVKPFNLAIIDELEIDKAQLNDRDYWLERLDEHQQAFLLLDEKGDTIIGLPALASAEEGWSWLKIAFGHDHSLETLDVQVKRRAFDNQHTLLIATTRSYEFHIIYRAIKIGFFWLFIIVIPLTLIIGCLLSYRVFQRLEGLSEDIEAIGSATLSKRLPLVGNHDEFDRLSSNINAMLDRIETLHGNIESVSVGIAHDLKTPLTRLSNRVQLIMLSNLLENSIEHGQARGNTWVRLQAYRDGALLQVGDDGPGIAAEESEQVFERFFRGDRSRNTPGNGLGLSLVKSICQLHQADIVVLPNQNGAVFDIYLPNL